MAQQYKCPICGATFDSKSELEEHAKKEHAMKEHAKEEHAKEEHKKSQSET